MTYPVIVRNLGAMTRSENPFIRPAAALPETNPFRPTSTADMASDTSPPATQPAPEASVFQFPTPASVEADLRIQALAQEARDVKAFLDQVQARYDGLRSQLWEAIGCQAVKKERYGFRFDAPKARRKTDLDRLERQWPEVYAEVVTKTEPVEDAVGSLYL